jgi:hypothetical protein
MAHDDFQREALPGLPEHPPEGERILWQGSPSWWRLAREALAIHWVALYFVLLAAWRGWAAWFERGPEQGVAAVVVLLVMGLVACGLIAAVAWVQAWATVYTITNRRVAMRVGAALTVTLNLPYRWIGSADLDLKPGGTGTIALDLIGDNKFSYLVLWPHIRPWHMKRPQPALRCIPDAERVARLLSETARAGVTRQMPGDGALPAEPAIAAE